jgi:hypothetical protein
VKPEEYAKLAQENEQLGETLEAMRGAMRKAGITHKFDDWLPSTPEQKGLVAAYRDAQKGLHKLPARYSDTHSIDVSDTQGFPLLFVDAKERDECAKVRPTVLDLFKSYRAEKDKP